MNSGTSEEEDGNWINRNGDGRDWDGRGGDSQRWYGQWRLRAGMVIVETPEYVIVCTTISFFVLIDTLTFRSMKS